MLRFIATLFLATLAIANAGTFGECSCKFKDGHVQKFQVSDCKASACYIECRQNAGGVQESCITKNEDSVQKALAQSSAISCDACYAKLADLPADDVAKICNKVLKCVPATAAPTVAPTTAAPAVKSFAACSCPRDRGVPACYDVCGTAFSSISMSCDKCISKLAEDLPTDSAQLYCTELLKCVPQSTLWFAMNNFATVAAGVPFTDCSTAGNLLKVMVVSLNPSPPKKGQNVVITISGNLASAVSSATAQLQVSLGNFQVLNQNFQLAGAAAGPVSQTVNVLVPGFAPGGTYTAKGVITSGAQQLACISTNFNL